MDHFGTMEGELDDIILFDFKKLQHVLKKIMNGMEDMRIDMNNMQQQQDKWESTLLSKVNALEKQVSYL